MPSPDQNTIGLSPTAAEDLSRVIESGWFNSELDACRMAMVIALKRGLHAAPGDVVKLTTKYNVGTFDRDGKVRQLLTLVSQDHPDGLYALAEELIHAGLSCLAEELSVEGVLLTDVMSQSPELPRTQ